MSLSHPTSSNGKPIIGLVAAKAASTGTQIRVVAAFQRAGGKGVWQRTVNPAAGCSQSVDPAEWVTPVAGDDGDFDPVGGADDAMAPTAPGRVGFTRNATGQTIYMFDQTGGLAKSTNYGAAFSTVKAATAFTGDKGEQAGWLAASPDDPNLLYVNLKNRAYRIQNANNCPAGCLVTPLTFSGLAEINRNFAGLTVDSSNRVLLANQPANNRVDTRISLLRASTSGGTALSDISDGVYRGLAVENNQLLGDPTGSVNTVLAANDGYGLIRITP